MRMHFYITYFLIALLVVSGCRIETAKPALQKRLVIASDYLNEGDTILFRSFSKSTHTRITILPWNKSKIIGEFRNNKYNTGIDLFMMKSMSDVHYLQKRKLFQPLKLSTNLKEEYMDFSSEKYDYFGFGYDPYVVAYPKQNYPTIKMYNDLTRHYYVKDLDDSEMIPMIAPVLAKMKKTDANKWLMRLYAHNLGDSIVSDSVLGRLPILTSYSNFQANMDNKFYSGKTIVLPNYKSTGTFYNLRTMCIAYQAENYNEALEFVDFYLSEENNPVLNKALNTIGVSSSEFGFRKYYVHSEEMLQYYVLVERSINRFSTK